MKSSKVLVVDDEAGIRQLFHDALTRRGYGVTPASDGIEAQKCARSEKYDLVFLDIKMPGLDGIATLRALRRQNPDILVVMMTGHASDQEIVRALDNGAFVCLNKPFSVGQILDTVKMLTS
jgi:DNA-binding response OmpR family regulator